MPGEILKEMYLEPLGLSIAAFAELIGVSRKTISAIVNGRAAVSVDMALRFSRAFNTTPDLWLNLQKTVDIWNARQKKGSWMQIQPIERAV
ncbi:MAG: HigA family addiction module antitoxin [Desulfovibrio sp.]|uniref:HigA family addiction module antitoxin n=1 Tax=Desulfovibrio sp. TaxID=885 RepID=UPI0025C439F4|nr:HigA family addiction module antitoxin [Desulfovibrio sp.]MCI7568517.1 HigA family addiction module antitoxin [Desulfovibrio sp.]